VGHSRVSREPLALVDNPSRRQGTGTHSRASCCLCKGNAAEAHPPHPPPVTPLTTTTGPITRPLALPTLFRKQGLPLLLGSFGTMAVLLFARPDAEPVRLWPVVGGQLAAAAIAVACLKVSASALTLRRGG
jgi:hypothetical protein